MQKISAHRPIIFGEVLFDSFPDGTNILGGAPFNVAWHLQGLGLSPLMVSAVGNDQRGQQVISTMNQWAMDTSGIQINNTFPTGAVEVSFSQGEPAYNILAEQAYDYIDWQNIATKLEEHTFSLLYHGSLAVRSALSRTSLTHIEELIKAPIFVDINLRPPWWKLEDVRKAIKNARWAKLNVNELAELMERRELDYSQRQAIAKQFFLNYELELLVITLGEEGAFCVTQDGIFEGSPVTVNQFVDTVGAGDSFSAVMITGLILEWPLETTLDRALEFSAAICGIQGATTMDRSLYEGFWEKWS